MAKPTRIKHSGLALYLNDKQIDRVQSLGTTVGLNATDVLEIGNVNVVEVIDGIPAVEVTIEANQYGSIKTASQLANKNFDFGYIQVSPSGGTTVNVSDGDYYINEMKYNKASVTSQNLAGYLPVSADKWNVTAASIDSSGNVVWTSGAAFAASDTPNYPDVPAGALKLAEVYLKNGMTEITSEHIHNIHNYKTINIKDFEYANADIVVPVKEVGDNTTSDPITRTMYIENGFCNRLDFTFNTGGASTERFTVETDNKKWFLNAARTVIVDRLARNAGGTYTLSQTPTQLLNGNYTLKCRVYDPSTEKYEEKKEGIDYTVSGTTVTFGAGKNPAAGTFLIFRYCANINNPDLFKMLPSVKNSHPDPAGQINQGQVEVYLNDDTSNFVLRVETATISADLGRDALNEIGHALPYDRPMRFPIPVTVTLNTKASDLQEYARLMNKGSEFASGSVNELDIDGFAKNLGLTVYVYREADTKRDEIPFKFQKYLKKIYIENLSVTDEASEVAVDRDATQNFTLKADNMIIEACV